MYWPNEPAHLPAFSQEGGRQAFAAMQTDGLIAALEIYSQRRERVKFGSAAEFEAAAMQAISAFAPDILFVQHLWGTDVSEDFWQRLKIEHPTITLAYHEGDPFDRFVKRVDAPTKAVLRHCDVVMACGLGSLAKILEDHTRAPVSFLSHCFVENVFAQNDPTSVKPEFEITMIGNKGMRRWFKGFYVPGGRSRALLAKRLSSIYGRRFALYGAGWEHLEASRGMVPFFEQEAAIQSARITANWDHFDGIAYYYSDRLPISLAAGRPHVTCWHEGYDHQFRDVPGLYACKTVDEAVETCRWLLSRPQDELNEQALAGRAWVFENMEAKRVFREAYLQALAVHERRVDGI